MENTSGGHTDPVREMQFTQLRVRLSYSLSTWLKSLAAANAIVEDDPIAMPAKSAPIEARAMFGTEQMMSATTMPSPAIIISCLGFFNRS